VVRLGDPGRGAVSLIAIHQHGAPTNSPDAVIAEQTRPTAGREICATAIGYIDPIDARDRDDAVYAAPIPNRATRPCDRVAIADVHYVTPGSALTLPGGGNSTYFDRGADAARYPVGLCKNMLTAPAWRCGCELMRMATSCRTALPVG
jgi:ribonuclease R